jgi:CheY-like chemotaxis protein
VQSRTILVVDDEYDIASTLELALEMEGYSIRTAFNGREAMLLLDGGLRPQLILTDMMMPVMDGYEFLETLKKSEEHKKIPIILMSAAQIDLNRLPKEGWVSFVRKPFDLDSLIDLIASLF